MLRERASRTPNLDVTYLDCNATAPLPLSLREEVSLLAQQFYGNPSSIHALGRQAQAIVRKCSEGFFSFLNASPNQFEIFWTSGGSESNSWVISALASLHHIEQRPLRILVSPFEHDSLLLACDSIVNRNMAKVDVCRSLKNGIIDLDHFQELLSLDHYDLVCVTAVSGETGVIQPIKKIAEHCHSKDVALHVDSVQILGKAPFSLLNGISFASFSPHKIGAPRGIGAIFVNRKLPKIWKQGLSPFVFGHQQKEKRGGTQNVFGIAVTGLILNSMHQGKLLFPKELRSWHNQFENSIRVSVPQVEVIGADALRLQNTTFLHVPGCDGQSLVIGLDLNGVCVSSGSACTAGLALPNKSAMSLGFSSKESLEFLRISSGFNSSLKDFEKTLTHLVPLIQRLRA